MQRYARPVISPETEFYLELSSEERKRLPFAPPVITDSDRYNPDKENKNSSKIANSDHKLEP